MEQLSRILRALVSDGRWRRSLALAIAFAIGCGLLSWWQFSRRAETAAANALITSSAAAAPVPLDELLRSRTAYRSTLQWRTVEVRGTYLTQDELLVRNRVDPDGDPGFEVLTPLRLADGTVFVLDRGWVSIGTKQDRPDSVPPAPSGTVTVEARLQADEGPCLDCFSSGEALTNVDLEESARRWPRFTEAAEATGFGNTHALPLRLRGRVIGALNLFTDRRRPLDDHDVVVGQAMADVAVSRPVSARIQAVVSASAPETGRCRMIGVS